MTPGWSLDFLQNAAYHSILPALTIIVSTVAGWMLTMRNSMVTTLSEDYVLMAQAKGLSSRRVMFAYAARNAILPSVTGLAIAIGAVVGGQLLVEKVFSYPGIGFVLYQGDPGPRLCPRRWCAAARRHRHRRDEPDRGSHLHLP